MVYNYTKPRGPIAAMYSSPGPCYALPGLVGQPQHDPRSVHYRGPAYPFGIRHGKFKDECSPGPTYYPSPKIYRDGQDGTPHYSLYSRPRDSTLFKTPGPGAYSPEKTGPTARQSPPAYSFGVRHRGRKTDNVPGKCSRQKTGLRNQAVGERNMKLDWGQILIIWTNLRFEYCTFQHRMFIRYLGCLDKQDKVEYGRLRSILLQGAVK